ncbi:hypothetical protein CPK_ORF00193 [Chlamydia pneumoniae LPCoLN]|uniref:Uncharacterized protein n=1 Tax=Chlamydia pneumoniae TaxID=83558 RepID=A0A0F7WW81_CHLPN|nr:hypothetical protein CPK_ORF00193 [Chlamydia pneumoniae LPCoLN]CRI38424.1 Uncharacterized protein BN1224_CV15_C_02570 [Chlamydia pneumoniae]CRI39556.1 Uncharacterized protein BN1224_CWL011_A_08200 [Chlamydia pneumoniae]CRI40687.1 Uncharacterized protein CWL029c_E_01110 [Chlamydia pneumoniae]CRI41815.1 Uncharacterized protein BN1224_GiD_A_08160 [Chlamydia pneumoniae]
MSISQIHGLSPSLSKVVEHSGQEFPIEYILLKISSLKKNP